MIKGFGVQNLRSLLNTGTIPVKPLTVLVGKNSCGKSTFARTYPLLRQSVEEKTRTPILWFGRYVDFGDFQDAIKSGEEEVTFSFQIGVKGSLGATSDENDFLSLFDDSLRWLESGTLECSLTVAQGPRLQFTKRLTAKVFGNSITIEANEDKEIISLKINNTDLEIDQDEDQRSYLSDGTLIPTPRFIKAIRNKSRVITFKDSFLYIENNLTHHLFDALSNIAHQNTQEETIFRLIKKIGIGSDKSIKHFLSSNNIMGKHFKTNIKRKGISSQEFQKIKNLIIASRVTEIFDFADTQISNHFRGIKYIEPLRATAERYYRVQDLAVDEIDPRGSNIAMYVKSLSFTELDQFNSWCKDALNFQVGYDQQPGHMAIKIIEENNERNITDMGFGYSQLLPIAMHIWHSCFRQTKDMNFFHMPGQETTTIVVEQPELHLHPAFQTKIADIFCKAANDATTDKADIIIETHSSHLINRLGELVSLGELNPDNIQIILFEREWQSDTTNIRTTTFDEDGFLKNWPIGFMQPEI